MKLTWLLPTCDVLRIKETLGGGPEPVEHDGGGFMGS